MAKRSQQDSGEERVTAKSRPMMSLIARAPSNTSSSTSESPEKRSYGNQNPWSAKAEREDRTGQPVVGSDPKTASDYYHEQSIDSSFSARYSKWDDNQAWSSQGWKTDTSMCDRSGQPVVTLGKDTRVPIKFLSWEDPARWNSAIHCERVNTSWSNGDTRCLPSNRSKATALCHWKRWNRILIVSGIQIILKQGEWSSAKKTETTFDECYRRRRKTFYDMGNVHVCNNGISSIHDKELLGQLPFHREHNTSNTQTNVRHIYEIGVWTRWDLWKGKNWLGWF